MMEIKYANEMIEKTNEARAIKSVRNKETALWFIKQTLMPEIESTANQGLNILIWTFKPGVDMDIKQWCVSILRDYGYKARLVSEDDSLSIKWGE